MKKFDKILQSNPIVHVYYRGETTGCHIPYDNTSLNACVKKIYVNKFLQMYKTVNRCQAQP